VEALLTVLVFVWQIGWVAVLGGALWALALRLIRPLRKRKGLTFAGCVLAVILLLAALCVLPAVIGGGAEERETARRLAAGPYSRLLPIVTPVCAVVDDGTVQVWYAFAGSQTYVIDSEGLPSVIDRLGPWE
jgi:drug/metabolite transporter (DMT)-like permease